MLVPKLGKANVLQGAICWPYETPMVGSSKRVGSGIKAADTCHYNKKAGHADS
jgi:hypothetical protein